MMKSYALIFITATLLGLNTYANEQAQVYMNERTQACLVEVGYKMYQSVNKLDKKYKYSNGIGVREGNGPGILPGTREEAVILVHGFMATPFEVIEIGRNLNAQGYTVYMPLIPGFGANANVANGALLKDWKSTVTNAMDIMIPCYQKISLVGFSLGAALISDFVLSDNVSMDGRYKDAQITSVSLLAPYFKQSQFGAEGMNWFLSLFTNSMSIKTLYKLSGHEDLKALNDNSQYYVTAMPLNAVKTIIAFGKELQNMDAKKVSRIPVFLSYSQSDKTVDVEEAEKFVSAHFLNAKKYVIPKKDKVPHQMAVRYISKEVDHLSDLVTTFVSQPHK